MSIMVKSQKELDKIPLDTNVGIFINFGTGKKPAIIKNKYLCEVMVINNSRVIAKGESSIIAYENSRVIACENSHVEARDTSYVTAMNNSSIIAYGSSSVTGYENSSIIAYEKSSVFADDNSTVVAGGNSSIIVSGNSSVEAYGSSSVTAFENSSIIAYENVQVVVKQTWKGNIQLLGNARKVCTPKNIEEFMDSYDIKHNNTTATFYKAVHKQDDEYVSNYDTNFKYEIGKLITEPNCSTDIYDKCGSGIHISHLKWALDFGRTWKNLAILELEVEIKDIVMPINSDGKVRTSKAKVIREVPLLECGVYGKVLAKKRKEVENNEEEK